MPQLIITPRFLRYCLFLLLMTACAKERAPLDRVQPNYLDKAEFIGQDFSNPSDDPEFFAKQTIIDVPFGTDAPWLMRGMDAGVVRIRWQITEEFLFGRLAYEEIDHTDGKGTGKPIQDGKIVVAFAIQKHFDIAREYNSSTGERLNVMEENDYDRPWYERRYFRVDFSQNQSKTNYNFDVMSQSTAIYGTEWESIAYNITDPNDPNAPLFDFGHGYFDVTVKAIASPALLDLTYLGWGEWIWPACWSGEDFGNGTYPWGSCNPSEVAIRLSFLKVKPSDYEPFPWDGVRDGQHGNIGAYYIQRFGYAHNYGMTEDQWYHFAGRFNIWERSHYYSDPEEMRGFIACNTTATTPYGSDPNRDLGDDTGQNGPNGTADECETVGHGSQCDTIRQRCTLPYRAREYKTIPYYYAAYGNPFVFDQADKALHEWDVALRIAIQAARYSECLNEGRLSGIALAEIRQSCAEAHPVILGSQPEQRDAVALALEFDTCLRDQRQAGWAEDRDYCGHLVDEIAAKRGYSSAVQAISKMPEAMVMCHSPVEAADPQICAPFTRRLPQFLSSTDCYEAQNGGNFKLLAMCNQAQTARMGDLRYSQVVVFDDPEIYGAWGYGPCTNDPLSGEIISCTANIWNDVTDYYSQYYIDILRYMNGETSTDQVTQGEDVKEWSQAAAASAGVAPAFSRETLTDRFDAFARQHQIDPHATPSDNGDLARALKINRMKLSKVRASSEISGNNQAVLQARLSAAQGSAFEASLMNEPMKQLFGLTGQNLNEGIMTAFSPLRGGLPSNSRTHNSKIQAMLGRKGICLFDLESMISSPFGTTGLAKILQEKFGSFNPNETPDIQHQRSEKMRRYLAEKWNFSVIAHELGHNMGMTHNFVASADAFSYWPEYWQLRTNDGEVKDPCLTYNPDGSKCIGPRYFDPVTDVEKNNIIWMWGSGSVMDYPGEVTADTLGIGPYDFSAMRSFYGDVATVFADITIDSDSGRALAMKNFDQFGGLLGLHPVTGCDKDWNCVGEHYTEMQASWQLIHDCRVVNPSAFQPTDWDAARYGPWHPLFDGWLVDADGDGQYTRCQSFQVDYVPYKTLVRPNEDQGGYYYSLFAEDAPILDRDGRVRVPWAQGDDMWADIGNGSVNLHDSGADLYEISNFWMSLKEVSHIFRNYRRNQAVFSIRSAVDRELWRYDWKMSDMAKGLALILFSTEDTTKVFRESLSSAWPYNLSLYKDNIVTATNVFDYFTMQAQRPQAGWHGYNYTSVDPVLRSIDDSTSLNYYFENENLSPVRIPNGAVGQYAHVSPAGRLLESRLDNTEGNYAQSTPLNAGSYYSKIFIPLLLSYSVDNFIPEYWDSYYDGRRSNMSYADLFPDGYRRFIGNFLTNDDSIKGPRIGVSAVKKPLLDDEQYPRYGIGWTSWWLNTPASCFPAEGTNICQTAWDENPVPNSNVPENVTPIDPQFGWEAQKFMIAFALLDLPENEQQKWLDQFRIWELGLNADPDIKNRIEFHDPAGKVYIAQTFGRETLFGKEVEKGIAARVLEYANELLQKAYVTEPIYDGDPTTGKIIGYQALNNPTTGEPQVKWEGVRTGKTDCSSPRSQTGCVCEDNFSCIELQKYTEIPAFIRQALEAYELVRLETVGIY